MKHKSALFIFPSSELLACSLVRAETPFTPDNKIAYGANLGWINLAGHATDGVVVGEFFLSGKAYRANVGWIDFGDGSPRDGTVPPRSAVSASHTLPPQGSITRTNSLSSAAVSTVFVPSPPDHDTRKEVGPVKLTSVRVSSGPGSTASTIWIAKIPVFIGLAKGNTFSIPIDVNVTFSRITTLAA